MFTSEHHLKWVAAMPAIHPPPPELQFHIFYRPTGTTTKSDRQFETTLKITASAIDPVTEQGLSTQNSSKTSPDRYKANPFLLYPPTRLWQKETSTGLHVPGTQASD